MKFSEIDFSKSVQIIVSSKEDEMKLCKLLHTKGFKWASGKSLLDLPQWMKNTKKIYYIVHPGDMYRPYTYVSFSYENYPWFENVINFNEIKESEEKEMKRNELKAGMNVLLRNGDECLVVEVQSGIVLFSEDTGFEVDINYYNDELKNSFRSSLDIVKVYSLPRCASSYDDFDGYGRDVIFDRAKTEIKEVTMQEIADQFGIAVETLRVKEQ